MPLIGTRGAASSGGFGQFARSGPVIGGGDWLGTLTSASNLHGWGSAVDSSGNIIIVGVDYASFVLVVVKYNSAGTIQWQKSYSAGFVYKNATCAVDSSGNIHIASNAYDTVTSKYAYLVTKLNSSGDVLWSNWFSYTGYDWVAQSVGIAVSSAGNVYVAGAFTSGQIIVVYYSSNGTRQQTNVVGSDSLYLTQKPYIAVASSGNVYLAGTTNQSGSNQTFIIKYDSSLNRSISPRQYIDNGVNTCNGLAIDSSENVYVCGRQTSPSVNFVLKVNSSLNVQFSTYTNASNSSFYPNSLALDSSGNIYFNIQASDSVGYAFFSFNSSGAVRWARTYKPEGATPSTGFMAISGSSFIFNGSFTYFSPTSLPALFSFGKMPTDGTKTGTYTIGGNTFVYAAYSTGTISAGSMSVLGSGSLTGSSAMNYSAATVTASTPTYTSTIVV